MIPSISVGEKWPLEVFLESEHHLTNGVMAEIPTFAFKKFHLFELKVKLITYVSTKF